jgi:hypothetical protein
MSGNTISVYHPDGATIQIDSVEQFDAVIHSAKASGRLITIKDKESIQILEESKQQLDSQQPSAVAASNEQLSQVRQRLLQTARTVAPVDTPFVQAVQHGRRDTFTQPLELASAAPAGLTSQETAQAFEAAGKSFTEAFVPEFSRFKTSEEYESVLALAEQFDFESKQAQLSNPQNKDYFIFRERDPVGKDYDTHKREYVDSLKAEVQQFVTAHQRFPNHGESLEIAAKALLSGYQQFIQNSDFNAAIAQYSPETQEQFHDLKASFHGDAQQAIAEGTTRLAISKRFAALGGVELNIATQAPVIISHPIDKAGDKKIIKELEASTTDPKLVDDLDEATGLPRQFVKDAARSDLSFIEQGVTHQPARNDQASILQQLNQFSRGNSKEAFALSTVANQAIFGSVYGAYAGGVVRDYKFVPAAAQQDTDPLGYSLERLSNGNVRLKAYQLQGLRSIEMFPSNPRSTLPSLSIHAVHNAPGTLTDQTNYGVRANLDVELDRKALEKGNIKVVKHQPPVIDVRLKLDWPNTVEFFSN